MKANSENQVLETMKLIKNKHCMKSARVRSYSGSHFPTFGLNADRYSVSL